MTAKVVNLHVHKNTLARKQRKALKRDFLSAARAIFDSGDVVSYAFVAITKDEDVASLTCTGPVGPTTFSLIVEQALRSSLTELEEPEDEN